MTEDIIDLDELAARLMYYADSLRTVSLRFDGYQDTDNDRMVPGVKLRYEEAIDEALDAIVKPYEAEGKRPPAEDVRAARARRQVKRVDPDLYDEYHALAATIPRIQRWISSARVAITARQSVLKTERELASQPPSFEAGQRVKDAA
jgi:hypothetical protein